MAVQWRQTSNSIAFSVSQNDYDMAFWREGYASFDFNGDGHKSIYFAPQSWLKNPRSSSDPDFLLFSVADGLIVQEPSPLVTKYVAGWVNDSLIGNFDKDAEDEIIFIDQGREVGTYSQFEFSYLWMLDRVNGAWTVKELGQEFGRQFWHSSSNPLDVNNDGVDDFVVSALSSALNVLFLSQPDIGGFKGIDVSRFLPEANSGSSALLHIAGGRFGVVSLPYTPSLPWNAGQYGAILTLTADGTGVVSRQSIAVRGTQETGDMTAAEGYPSIRVLDLNGDGLDDFVALAESYDGSLGKLKRLVAFVQDSEGHFSFANTALNIPFTYTPPGQSAQQWQDFVDNQVTVADANADGVADLIIPTSLVSTVSVDQLGIRGGLISSDGTFIQLDIPSTQILWNAEQKPALYSHVIPVEINGDGVLDYFLVGTYNDQPVTDSNRSGTSLKLTMLVSEVLPEKDPVILTMNEADHVLKLQGSDAPDVIRLNSNVLELSAFAGDDLIYSGMGAGNLAPIVPAPTLPPLKRLNIVLDAYFMPTQQATVTFDILVNGVSVGRNSIVVDPAQLLASPSGYWSVPSFYNYDISSIGVITSLKVSQVTSGLMAVKNIDIEGMLVDVQSGLHGYAVTTWEYRPNWVGGLDTTTFDVKAYNNNLAAAKSQPTTQSAKVARIDGGLGTDTAIYSAKSADYSITHNVDGSTTVKTTGSSDQLFNVERLKFADKQIALDLGATQPAGETVMLLGAVLPGRLVFDSSKQALLGAVIDLFDHGYSLQALAGAVMRLPIWDILTGKTAPTSADIATFLLTNVNGVAPDATALANAAATLNIETDFATQGNFLWHLAESSTNQTHVGLVGLASTGLPYTV